MHKHLQSLLVVGTIVATYLWLQIPALQQYSLQAFAGAILVYFILKRVKKAKLWHVMPTNTSAELLLITFAFLLLIGSTGNLHSYFYPLAYLHLFLLVMTTSASTAIIGMTAVMVFHYALTPTMSSPEFASLSVFPLLLLFFLFAKRQYDEVRLEKKLMAAEKAEIAVIEESEASLENYLDGFLKPKLQTIKNLLQDKEPNLETVEKQLSLLESESEKILHRVKHSNHSAKSEVEALTQPDHDQTS